MQLPNVCQAPMQQLRQFLITLVEMFRFQLINRPKVHQKPENQTAVVLKFMKYWGNDFETKWVENGMAVFLLEIEPLSAVLG